MAASTSPQYQPHLSDTGPEFGDEFHWSDVQLCLAALPSCVQQPGYRGPVGLPPELSNLGLTDLGHIYHTERFAQHQTHGYVHHEQLQQLLLTPTSPLNPRQVTRRHAGGVTSGRMTPSLTSVGHRAPRQLDEPFAVSRRSNMRTYVHRPMRVPPSGFQVLHQSQANPEILNPIKEQRERFRRRKWFATRDSWPSFTAVVKLFVLESEL